jgi:hypothetical protein
MEQEIRWATGRQERTMKAVQIGELKMLRDALFILFIVWQAQVVFA